MPNLLYRVQVGRDFYEAGTDPGAEIGGCIPHAAAWDNDTPFGGYPENTTDDHVHYQSIGWESRPFDPSTLPAEMDAAALMQLATEASNLTGLVTAEATARSAADGALGTDIAANEADIGAEEAARIAADDAQDDRLDVLESATPWKVSDLPVGGGDTIDDGESPKLWRAIGHGTGTCLLYTSPSPRDRG